jgi:PAS domain S-box-containing protein
LGWGALGLKGTLQRFDTYLVPATGIANAWIATLGAAFAVALVYFLAAQVGLAFLAMPSEVAVFWPASGIAAGVLVAAGRRAAVALVVGVVVGTVAANLMNDRSVLTAVLKGFCNAGESVLVAWLLDRWFGQPFAFSDLRRVVGFFGAAAFATAISAIGGAVTMTRFHTSAPFWDAWGTWFLASAIGIVVVAPLLIELCQLRGRQPSRVELTEGAAVLALTALVSMYAVSHPTGSWLSFDPDAIVFPLLLWLAIRHQRAFAIAGAFVVSFVVIGATAYGIGHFGNVSASSVERVLGVQLVATMVTAFTLVVTAVFAERRKSEEGLRQSEERLHLAQLKTGVGIWDWDVRTGKVTCTPQLETIFGVHQGTVKGYSDFRDRVHTDDIEAVEAQRDAAVRRKQTFNLEFRIIRPDGQVRWILASGGALYDEATGEPTRILGNNVDITERKLAELSLADRNKQLELAGKAALVGRFAIEIDAAREDFTLNCMRVSPGFCAIYGLPEETAEISVGDWRSHVHPDDLPQFLEHRQQVFAERHGEHRAECRIVRPCGTIRWIESRSYVEYDQAGHAKRMVGVNIDITERKRAEEARTILNAELDHRVKNALATVNAVVFHTREGSTSVDGFMAALEGRLRSMATTHELLSSRRWQGLPLTELVQRELAPYAARNNTEINGAGILLKPEAGQALAMVLHELATNAAKYGALSTKEGRVSIRWDRHLNGQPRSHLALEWEEIGGPPVVAPGVSSYGTSTIRDLIPYELGGTVDLVLAPEGVRCRLELPADCLSNDREPASETNAHASPRTGDA